jgi:hypothetical protein
MAAPHVTGIAALLNAARGLEGLALREAILRSVDAASSMSGRTVTGGRLNAGAALAPPGGVPAAAGEIVLHASQASRIAGDWRRTADATAAGGVRLQSTNAGAAKVGAPLASPSHYFELTFDAEAGRAYRLWMRGRADGNSWANDSVFVQFDGSLTQAGAAGYRIGTTSALTVNIEDCSGCGLSAWGWQDPGYGVNVLGPTLRFARTGPQRLRVQVREDGIGIDQIVLSSGRYASAAPGALKNDRTLLAASVTTMAPGPQPAPSDEIVLHAAAAPTVRGRWSRTPDATAASGTLLQNPNAAAPRRAVALASPADYFELSFSAEAGKPYRLWLRSKAAGNGWANDSVFVQFSDSLGPTGTPAYRIGTTSAAEVNLEDCSGCGLAGWGWQDNGYGAGVRGPEIRFAASGTHTIRVQVREDGLGIDQIVLSAAKYLTASPGALKNDTRILPRTGG